MKVAIIFDNYGPYHLARLRAAARRLAVVGVEVRPVSMEYSWEPRSYTEDCEIVTVLRSRGAKGHAGGYKELGSALFKAKPDAVAVPGWSERSALWGLRWCLEHGVPAILMSESQSSDALRRGWREGVKKGVVRCFSAALVGGNAHAEYLSRLGMADGSIFLGYDAVDNRYFAEKALDVRVREAEVRKQRGLPRRYFLASARFVEKKNLHRLIEAYSLYRTLDGRMAWSIQQRWRSGRVTFPFRDCMVGVEPWDLVILGDGPLRASLESMVSALNLRGRVLLPGFMQYPDLPAYYGLASAFVHVSTTEQWGLVVNEAMASGLPVLVSNRCGCARDLVHDGVNGFSVDPYNVEVLAQRMAFVADLVDSEATVPEVGALVSSDSPSSGSLTKMGVESVRIISDWGPERFAIGLVRPWLRLSKLAQRDQHGVSACFWRVYIYDESTSAVIIIE